MVVEESVRRLARESHGLAEFVLGACKLRGVGVTRASVEAGLSRGALSAYVRGARTPDCEAVVRVAGYFGVGVGDVLRLAGHGESGGVLREIEGLDEVVLGVASVLDERELSQWIEYGEMLLLLRQRRMVEERRGEVEGELHGEGD